MHFFFLLILFSNKKDKNVTRWKKKRGNFAEKTKSHLCAEVLVGACCVMQPLDEQSEELFEAQAQALHLVRPPARVSVLDPTKALDQSAVHVWKQWISCQMFVENAREAEVIKMIGGKPTSQAILLFC